MYLNGVINHLDCRVSLVRRTFVDICNRRETHYLSADVSFFFFISQLLKECEWPEKENGQLKMCEGTSVIKDVLK